MDTQLQSQSQQSQNQADERLAMMNELNNGTQLNEMGLPKAVYRADILPPNLFSLPQQEQHELIQLASQPLSYAEGFPTLNGQLFWERFPWESETDFYHFQEYLKLHDVYGYRSLALLAGEIYPQHTYPSSFDSLRTQLIPSVRKAFVYYSWGYRTKAYDMISAVAYERLRERRAMETENYHYLQFNSMFKRLQQHWKVFEENTEEAEAAWSELGIMDTIRAMKEVVGVQRVAAGLPASAPISSSGGGKSSGGDGHLGVGDASGLTIEQRLLLLAKKQQSLTDMSGQSTSTSKMDDLMKDPAMMALAQELITRSALPNANPNANPNLTKDPNLPDTTEHDIPAHPEPKTD